MKKLRAAVIGAGHLGKEHARIYHELPDVELVAICDKDASKSEYAAAYNTQFVTDYRTILNDIDIASISTPTSTHYPLVKAALNAGTIAELHKSKGLTYAILDYISYINPVLVLFSKSFYFVESFIF